MASRYWICETVGGGDWSDTNNWSDMSGGSGGAGVPTLDDDVYFDDGNGLMVTDCNIDIAYPVCNAFYFGVASEFAGNVVGSPSTVLVKSGSVQVGPTVPGGITNVTFLPLAAGNCQAQGAVISFVSAPIRPKLTIHAEESGNQVAAAQTEVELAAVGSVEMPVSIDGFVEAIFTPFGGAEQLLDSDTYSFVADDETSFEDIFGANPVFDLPATPGAWGGILRIDVYTDSGKSVLMASAQQVLAATDFPLAEELRYGVKTQYETVTGTSEEMPLTQAWVEVAAEKVGAVQIGQTGYVKGYLSLQQTKTAGVTITLTIAGVPTVVFDDDFNFVAGNWYSIADIVGSEVTFEPAAGEYGINNKIEISVSADGISDPNLSVPFNITDFPAAGQLASGVYTQYATVEGTMPKPRLRVTANAIDPDTFEIVGACQLGQTVRLAGSIQPESDGSAHLTVTGYDNGVPTLLVDEDFNFVNGVNQTFEDIAGAAIEMTPSPTTRTLTYFEWTISGVDVGTVGGQVQVSVTDFPTADQLVGGLHPVKTQYQAVTGSVLAGMPIVRDFAAKNSMDETVGAIQIGATFTFEGNISFSSDQDDTEVDLIIYDKNGVEVAELYVAYPVSFSKDTPRTLADIFGEVPAWTPPATGEYYAMLWIMGDDGPAFGAEVTAFVGCSATDFPAAAEVEDGVEFFYGTLEGELPAGGGGAVQDVSIMDPTETYQILRGSKDTAYPVGGRVVFDADTAGVSIELAAYDITNPAAPVLLGYLIPTGLFDFTAGVPRTLADLAGGTLEFTPTTDGDFLLSLVVAPPSPASADEVVVQFTTQPIGPTPPTPPTPIVDQAVECTRDYPENLSQGFNIFPLNPAMLRKFNVVGDWGLVVNQPTYPKNGFFVNSVSGLPALGQTAEFRAVVAAGEYTFRLWAPKNNDCGMVDVEINGFSVAVNQDLYAAALDAGNVIEIPRVRLAAGLQRIKFTISGKNPASSNFFFRMIGFDLAPWQPGTV